MDFKMVHVKFMSFLVVWNDKAVDDWNVVLPTMKEVVGSKGALFHEEWHTDGISDDFRKQATGAGGSFDVVFSDKKPEKTTIRNVPTKPGFNEAVKVAYRDRLLRELRRAAPDPNAKTKPR